MWGEMWGWGFNTGVSKMLSLKARHRKIYEGFGPLRGFGGSAHLKLCTRCAWSGGHSLDTSGLILHFLITSGRQLCRPAKSFVQICFRLFSFQLPVQYKLACMDNSHKEDKLTWYSRFTCICFVHFWIYITHVFDVSFISCFKKVCSKR